MIKYLKFIFDIQRIYVVIPMMLVIIYGPGTILGFYRLGPTDEVLEFLSIFAVSLLVYFIAYFFLKYYFNKRLIINSGLPVGFIADVTFFSYLLYIVYVVITAPEIPLFLAIKGSSSSEISHYRELFFKARTGIDSILVYINALFTVAIMPFLTASLFIVKSKKRYFYLLFFIFTLFLSMEKSLIARALLPLMVLIINGIIHDRLLSLKRILLAVGFGLFFITFLSIGKLAKDETKLMSEVVEIDPNAAKYFVVSNPDNVFEFILNRIFWIPYITAIDWLSFNNEILRREYVMGASSTLIASAFGMERVNLERLVFEYEWGQNDSGTGSANTVYFIDVFLNFGWIGVIVSNLIIALVIRYFEFIGNNAAMASFFVFSYFIATSTLIGVLFSSGLIFLMLLIPFIKN